MTLLDPEFDRRIRALTSAAVEAGYDPSIVSGYRSHADQARAINSVAQHVYGRPASVVDYARGIKGYAAPVGGSQHEAGRAVDFSPGPALDWIRTNAPAYGVSFPRALAKTDPVHAEVDRNFMGPVQDPRDRAAVLAAANLAPSPTFEIPASKGGSGQEQGRFAGGKGPAPGSFRAAQETIPPPMMLGGPKQGASPMPQEPQGLPGLLGGLQSIFMNPLFLSGAAMVNAGAEGKNFGAGLLAGGQAGAQAAQHQAMIAKAQREQQAQAQRAALWANLGRGQMPTGPDAMPGGTYELARALGPDAGVKFLTDMMVKRSERGIERDKLSETQRYHDILADQNRQRDEDLRVQRESQRTLYEANAELRREQVDRLRREAETERRLFGGGAPAAPAQQPAVPPRDPNIRPQSFEPGPQGDPNLIRVQDAAAPAAPAGPAVRPMPPPVLPKIQVPKSERFPNGTATPEEATTFAQELLATEKFRPLGQQILKQVEQAREDSGLEKGARGEVEKTLISQVNHLARLEEMKQGLDPRYLDIRFRGAMELAAKLEKAGQKLSPEQTEDLQRYTAFRARTIRNMNTLLKELSGAAVTQQEFDRLRLAEPDAGTGGWTDFLKGDSYGQFIAKLGEAERAVKLAVARSNWLRNTKGFDSRQIEAMAKAGSLEDQASLPGIQRIMSREREKIENQIRQQAGPGANEDEIKNAVRARMKGVFGI